MTESPSPEKSSHPSPFDQYAFMWMLAIILGYYALTTMFEASSEHISYSDFKLAVTEERVESVTFRGDQIRGIFRGENGSRFMTVQPTPPDASLLPALGASGV